MTTLLELSRRVSEAEGPSRELDAEVFQAVIGKLAMSDPDQWKIGPYAIWGDAHGPRPVPRYTGSLDAVAALIAEKLPGWSHGYEVDPGNACAGVSPKPRYDERAWKDLGGKSASAKTPDLALLAATLLAIHERNKTDE